MKTRLQSAKISFDLKQEIYQRFISKDYDFTRFTNFINSLTDDNLRNMVAELAYAREAYHE